MNNLETLHGELRAQLPEESVLAFERPVHPQGVWTLDISHLGRHLVVDWTPNTDCFGISTVTADTGYGEGPDEIAFGLEATRARIQELLTANTVSARDTLKKLLVLHLPSGAEEILQAIEKLVDERIAKAKS